MEAVLGWAPGGLVHVWFALSKGLASCRAESQEAPRGSSGPATWGPFPSRCPRPCWLRAWQLLSSPAPRVWAGWGRGNPSSTAWYPHKLPWGLGEIASYFLSHNQLSSWNNRLNNFTLNNILLSLTFMAAKQPLLHHYTTSLSWLFPDPAWPWTSLSKHPSAPTVYCLWKVRRRCVQFQG